MTLIRYRHPSASPLDDDTVEAAARALVLVRGARSVRVTAGVLEVDGARVATPARAVLVRFVTD